MHENQEIDQIAVKNIYHNNCITIKYGKIDMCIKGIADVMLLVIVFCSDCIFFFQ